VKCGRCQKDVPVLTPSPEGDMDLCGDCYAAVYRQLHAARGFPKKPIIAAVVAAVAAVAAVCLFVAPGAPGDSKDAPAPKTETSALVGPNKPDPRKTPKRTPAAPVKPAKTAPAAKPAAPAQTPPPDEDAGEPDERADQAAAKPDESGEAAEPAAEETQPKAATPPPAAARLETAAFVLTASGAHRTAQASVSVHKADGQTGTQTIHVPETEILYEVSLALAPTAEDDIVVTGLALRVGGTPFIPIQARLFGGPYLGPSEAAPLLSESAAIVVSFGAEEDSIAVSDHGEELVALRRTRPASIPLTVLFALPRDMQPGESAAIVLPEGEIPVALR